MPDPTQVSALYVSLIAGGSAVLGGLIALAGSVIVHKMDESRAIRQIYRERLERIAERIEDSVEWFRSASSANTLEELASSGRCESAREAYTLACLYFPELREPIGEYSNSLIHLHGVLVDVWQPGRPLNAGAQAIHNPEYNRIFEIVRNQRNRLEDQIGSIAQTHNKP